jgi:ABC-2 type transport system permease protein
MQKIGVLMTDAPMLVGGQASQRLISELEKVYEVVPVDPAFPIVGDFKALIAVQPSTLGPGPLQNFIDAVKNGMPTAIFEDPYAIPDLWQTQQEPGYVVGTGMPGGNPFAGVPPKEKGRINDLWDLLKINFASNSVVWQAYNPFPKISQAGISREWVFIDKDMPADFTVDPNNPITSGLGRLLFLFPGNIEFQKSNLKYQRLVGTTDKNSGAMSYADFFGSPMILQPIPDPGRVAKYVPSPEAYTLAARITGVPEPSADAGETVAGTAAATGGIDAKELNVVVVADIDFLHSALFNLREQDPNMQFDNVPFVLNIIDVLAGEELLIEIRKHIRRYHTLETLESKIADASEKTDDAIAAYREKLQQDLQKESTKVDGEISALDQQFNAGKLDQEAYKRAHEMIMTRANNRMEVYKTARDKETERDIRLIQRELDRDIQSMQSTYKLFAVLLPPLIPLIVGIAVFFHRRSREKLGVAATRMR